MHQKSNNAEQSSFAAGLDADEDKADELDDDQLDPFADADDNFDDDDDDDLVTTGNGARGAWWRGVVGRSDNKDEDGSDDDEFGDFAMAEGEEGGKGETSDDKVVLKPLPVHPAKESNRGLGGLWPFSALGDKDKPKEADTDGEPAKQDTLAPAISKEELISPTYAEFGKDEGEESKAVEVKEATRRTSIEGDDDDDVYSGEFMAGSDVE
jgi:hypothetical protein